MRFEGLIRLSKTGFFLLLLSCWSLRSTVVERASNVIAIIVVIVIVAAVA